VSDNGPVESQPREVVILGSTGSIGTVTVYLPGGGPLIRTISDGVNGPHALAFGP